MAPDHDAALEAEIHAAAVIAWQQTCAEHPEMDRSEPIRAAFMIGFACGAPYGFGKARETTEPQ